MCKACGKWDFNVDEVKKFRIVPLFDGTNMLEMRESVVMEFGVDVDSRITLSYWSP